jgi:hypothetical protein
MPKVPHPALIKLASIAVHADEMIEDFIQKGDIEPLDIAAVESLMTDPDVRRVLEELDAMTLLPAKRSEGKE